MSKISLCHGTHTTQCYVANAAKGSGLLQYLQCSFGLTSTETQAGDCRLESVLQDEPFLLVRSQTKRKKSKHIRVRVKENLRPIHITGHRWQSGQFKPKDGKASKGAK